MFLSGVSVMSIKEQHCTMSSAHLGNWNELSKFDEIGFGSKSPFSLWSNFHQEENSILVSEIS